MIDQITTWLLQSLQTEIFGGLAAVSALGYIVYALREVPRQTYRIAKRAFTAELVVRSDDVMFLVMAQWLSRQSFMRKSRRVKLISRSTHAMQSAETPAADTNDESGPSEWIFVPSPGYHYFWYKGQPILLHVDDGQDADAGGRKKFMIVENITMSTLGRNAKIFEQIMQEAAAIVKAERRILVVAAGDRNYWGDSQRKLPRALSSVVTKNGVADELLSDMTTFFNSREWYSERGIPWRRGYMLSGPPGTGKSSLVFALASELNLKVFSLSLGADLSDGDLASLLIGLPEKSLLLIEDIDTFDITKKRTTTTKQGKTKNLITLSGVLNALDGVTASEGRIVVMTTNHEEHLDPALTRAGRIDVRKQLDFFGPDECVKMWRLFFSSDSPHEALFEKAISAPVQPARLQRYMMQYRDDPAAAAEHAASLIEKE